MLPPRKVKFEAGKKENENLEFRTFLKCNADEKELDQQFVKLHNELFAEYDCSRCRNCCKMYHGSIPAEDLERDAEYLGVTREQFTDCYLEYNEVEENYETKHKPCDFLLEDGSCKLLGLFNTKYEADQAYKRKYGSLDTYDGFKGHYIKYVPLPKEGEVVDIEVANWLYIPR